MLPVDVPSSSQGCGRSDGRRIFELFEGSERGGGEEQIPAKILMKLDVGSEELSQVDFGLILLLLFDGRFTGAVLQLADFRRVIGARAANLQTAVQSTRKIAINKLITAAHLRCSVSCFIVKSRQKSWLHYLAK